MKTKTLLKISIFAMLPMFLSTLMVSMIGFEWLLNGTGGLAERLLTGEFNKPFTVILFTSGILSMSIIFTALLGLMRYTDKLDKLDEAEIQAWEAKRKYEAATRKLLQNV